LALATGVLLAAGGGLLFLSAAATIDVGFTVKPSYLLLAVAAGLGAPWTLKGWRQAPARVRQAGALLVVVYIIGVIAGHHASLPSQHARSNHRALAYLVDLLVGMSVMGLVSGFLSARWPLGLATFIQIIAAGAIAGAALGIYQWLARHYGWPGSDINNAVNSDGFSFGHRYQGAGLFGWERARGSFKEPLAMATFLAASLPLVVNSGAVARPPMRWVWAAGAVVVAAGLAVTDSALGWTALIASLVVISSFASVTLGRPRWATVSGVAVAFLLLMPFLASHPSAFTAITNRGGNQLTLTVGNRTGAWARAITVWEQHPIVGDGPGQSAVRLSYRPSGAALRPGLVAPPVLGSAQGLWAATLIDGGIFGLAAWAAFLIAVLAAAVSSATRRPQPFSWGILTSGLVYLILGQVTGDRLDMQVWVLLGLVLATCGQPPQCEHQT